MHEDKSLKNFLNLPKSVDIITQKSPKKIYEK